MNSFVNAMNTGRNMGVTENGAKAHLSSGSKLLDLFFHMGAARGKENQIVNMIRGLQNTNELRRMVFWGRDVRGGAGERETFRAICRAFPEQVMPNFELIPVYGRWDDLLVLFESVKTQGERNEIAAFIHDALNDANVAGLCAKWMPRQGKIAGALRSIWGLSPKQYRKMLVERSNTVEQKMCAKEWDKINYNHVPSVAASRYQKAFNRNDGQRYADYKAALVKGTAKVNAAAIFPHDVLKGTDDTVVQAQWDALPNYIGKDVRLLPICDVSGSMIGLPMEVCVALGLYIAERNKSVFKDKVLTFHSNPTWFDLSKYKGIRSKEHALMSAPWGMSTDFEKAYMLILNAAVNNSVPQEDMPTHLIVLSDMQFNQAGGNSLHFDNMKKKFAAAGYEMPNIIFWNLRAVLGTTPCQITDNGTALVSGFSPAVLKAVLDSGNVDPLSVMMTAIMNERYDLVK